MSAKTAQQQQDMGGAAKDKNIKKAPQHFEDDEDDVGDVEENLNGGPRGRPGPQSNFQTNTSENPNRGMHIDQRGAQKRGNSSKRRKSADRKKGNQMANKSYQSSEIGGDESHFGDPEFAKDFNSAYQKLVEKIYQEQGNTLLVSQDEIYKLEHTKQLSEEEFRARVMEYHEKKLQKIAQKQEDNKDKDLEGCTFRPEFVTPSSQEPKRNLDQFIQDQQRFLEKVNKKREDQKKQLADEEVSVMHPSIDETSKRIVEEKMGDRKNKTTHERLYELNKEQQLKKQAKLQEIIEHSKNEATHNVTLSKRDKPLDITLYEDAERRRNENAQKKAELDRTRDIPKEKYYHNDTSDKYVQRKFERELQQLEQEMATEGGNEEQKEDNGLLNYQRMCEALTQTGFLPRDKPQIEAIDQQLCQDLWRLVRGEDRGGLSWNTFRVLTLNFIGIRTPDREKDNEEAQEQPAEGDQPAENPSSDVSRWGFFEEDTFYIRRGDGKRIFTHFKNFYVHRMHYVGIDKVKRPATHPAGPESFCQSKPQISDKTSKFAENKRKKLLGDKPVTSSIEIFLLPKHNEAELEQKRKMLYEKQVDGCTFKPKTLDYNTGTKQQEESAGNKNETLYMTKPKGWFKDKEFKSTYQLEYEKSIEDCTFRPTINDPSNLQILQEGNVEQIRGVNKTMERLAKARQSQLEKKLMTERGMPNQLMASVGKPEPTMNFGSNTNKFKSGFGVDGSQLNPKKSRQPGFGDSQKINTQQLSSRASRPQPVRKPAPVVSQPPKQASRQNRQSQQQQQQQPEYYEEEHEPEQINIQQQQVQQQQQMNRHSSKAASKTHLHQQQQQQQHHQQEHYQEQHHDHEEDEQEEQHDHDQEQEVENEEQYQEPEDTYQEDTEQREGMNDTDYEGQQFAGGQESSEQSPVKSSTDREPMLYVDVNLGNSGTQRIVVFEGDTAEGLAEKFSIEYNLDENMKEKLTLMLQQQIAGVLEKIEEVQSNNSDNLNQE